MGYTMEKVPWHEGWIAMMLYIAIEERERERERAIGSPSPPLDVRMCQEMFHLCRKKKCEY